MKPVRDAKKVGDFCSTVFVTHNQFMYTPSPADGALASDDVTLAIVEAEVELQLADAPTRQTVHAQVPGGTNTLRLPGPAVHQTPGEVVTRLELTGVRPVTWGADLVVEKKWDGLKDINCSDGSDLNACSSTGCQSVRRYRTPPGPDTRFNTRTRF